MILREKVLRVIKHEGKNHTQDEHTPLKYKQQEEPGGRGGAGVVTVGLNGDIYQGGQFLPMSEFSKAQKKFRVAKKKYMEKKQEIAPYKWETPTAYDQLSVFGKIREIPFDHKAQKFNIVNANKDYMNYIGKEAADEIVKLATRFNSGERWMEMNPLQFKNIHGVDKELAQEIEKRENVK